MKKILGLLLLGIFAVFFTMKAFADEDCCQGMKMMGAHEKMSGHMGRGGLEEKFFDKARLILNNSDELGLNEEQGQKIKALKLNTKKSLIKNNAEKELMELDVEAALEKDQLDLNAVNALVDKEYAMKAQAVKSYISAYAELKGILSKEQMAKLREIWRDKSEGGCGMGQSAERMEHMEHMENMGQKSGLQKKM